MNQHQIHISDRLYIQLKGLADRQGQSVESFVEETLEETIEARSLVEFASLMPLPDPEALLPPYGSPEEAALRAELAAALSQGPSLSKMIIEDRGER